jgi:hypothetical protein
MPTEDDPTDRMFAELQELVTLEVKDILATAADEGYALRDVVAALELALQAEIAALAAPPVFKRDGPAEDEDD